MFVLIKEAHETNKGNILSLPTKTWQQLILERGITHTTDQNNGEVNLILTPQETSMTDINWQRSRELRSTPSLPPQNKSLILKWTENLCINRERLFRLAKCESPCCEFCTEEEMTDNRQHLWFCRHNSHINKSMMDMLEAATGQKPSPNQLATVDFDLTTSLRLPILFIFSTLLEMILEARSQKKILYKGHLKQLITTKSKIYLSSRRKTNNHELIKVLMEKHFDDPE